MLKPPFDIDVVYTWAGEGGSGMRNEDHGELKYSLRSVAQFMPYARKIFILMNPPAKAPSWFAQGQDRVVVVDHDAVFGRDDIPHPRPVTNSNSIETALGNIPGLAEHFVYFNDDVFLSRPLEYTFFFSETGKPMAQPRYKLADTSRTSLTFAIPPMPEGFSVHTAFPMTLTGIRSFLRDYRDFIAWIRSFNTRSDDGCISICDTVSLPCPCQQAMISSLSAYMLQRGEAAPRETALRDVYGYSYFNDENLRLLETARLDELADTFVINDSSPDPEVRQEFRRIVPSFLARSFPRPAPFERAAEKQVAALSGHISTEAAIAVAVFCVLAVFVVALGARRRRTMHGAAST